MFCPTCNSQIPDDIKQCPYCATPFGNFQVNPFYVKDIKKRFNSAVRCGIASFLLTIVHIVLWLVLLKTYKLIGGHNSAISVFLLYGFQPISFVVSIILGSKSISFFNSKKTRELLFYDPSLESYKRMGKCFAWISLILLILKLIAYILLFMLFAFAYFCLTVL